MAAPKYNYKVFLQRRTGADHSRMGMARREIERAMRDRSGTIIIKFALALPILLTFAGVAIDYAMFTREKQKLQTATDGAATAAALEMTLIDYTKIDVGTLVRSMVLASMNANLGSANPIQVVTRTKTEPLQVSVDAVKSRASLMGTFGLQQDRIIVRSIAQVVGKPNICVLGLDPEESGTIELWSKARMTGQNCAVYSNSSSTTGIVSKNTAKLSATMICSVGGTDGAKGSMSPTPITDCPSYDDPLASRVGPNVGACNVTNHSVSSGAATLQPGTYCGGLSISGNATVTLSPGVYVMKDGPLLVTDDAKIAGEGVGLYFTGAGAKFSFATATTISLKAPTDGPLAGLLMFESRDQNEVLVHEINSDNARMLLGTIYLPKGELRIDANQPVASESAYTAIVARKLRLYSGPHLVLNTDYGSTTVPVPEGLKGIGQPVAIVQ